MEIDINKILSRFKVNESPQLFDIEREDFFRILKEGRCIYCGCKLILMRNGKMYYCKSVKHKQRFIISSEKFRKITGK